MITIFGFNIFKLLKSTTKYELYVNELIGKGLIKGIEKLRIDKSMFKYKMM